MCPVGHHWRVRHPVDLLLFIASVLTLTSAMITLVTLEDQSKHPPRGRTWWAKFVAQNRRRPLLRGIQLACLAVALVTCISYVIIVFS
jgi:hypothetical protein